MMGFICLLKMCTKMNYESLKLTCWLNTYGGGYLGYFEREISMKLAYGKFIVHYFNF